jgi:hypothetical protein
MENDSRPGFSTGWRLSGYAFLALAAIFVLRIVYEETVLTWLDGPHMVGFALVHTLTPLYLLTFFIGLAGGLLWVVAALIALIHRKFRIPVVDWIPIVLLLAHAGLLTIAQGTWVELMLRIAGRSPYEYTFMAEAAAEGNQRLVNYILRKGYDIEGGGQASPLSAAAGTGRNEMVVFLISRGADANRRWERTEDTPLMDAAEMGNLDTVKVLIEKGAEPRARNLEEHAAEGLARKSNYAEVAQYLAQYRCQDTAIVSCGDPRVCACVHP